MRFLVTMMERLIRQKLKRNRSEYEFELRDKEEYEIREELLIEILQELEDYE